MTKPAIVVVAYNREKSLQRLLDSLKNSEYKTEGISLVISVDHAGDDNPCYEIAENFEWEFGEKRIIKREKNLGLKEHILTCGDLVNEYESVIILEDDIEVSPAFYTFALKTVNSYFDDPDVIGIALYSPAINGFSGYPKEIYQNGMDVYAEKWVTSWGECFIKDQWNAFRDWLADNGPELRDDPKIPSIVNTWKKAWSKYMVHYMNEENKWFIVPHKSYTTNCNDGGVHGRGNNGWQVNMMQGINEKLQLGDIPDLVHLDAFLERIYDDDLYACLGVDHNKKIGSDIHGLRRTFDGYDYMVSTAELPFTKVASFGMVYHPAEVNILKKSEGDELFVYKLDDKPGEIKNRRNDRVLMEYYYPFLSKKNMLKYLTLSRI